MSNCTCKLNHYLKKDHYDENRYQSGPQVSYTPVRSALRDLISVRGQSSYRIMHKPKASALSARDL